MASSRGWTGESNCPRCNGLGGVQAVQDGNAPRNEMSSTISARLDTLLKEWLRGRFRFPQNESSDELATALGSGLGAGKIFQICVGSSCIAVLHRPS